MTQRAPLTSLSAGDAYAMSQQKDTPEPYASENGSADAVEMDAEQAALRSPIARIGHCRPQRRRHSVRPTVMVVGKGVPGVTTESCPRHGRRQLSSSAAVRWMRQGLVGLSSPTG